MKKIRGWLKNTLTFLEKNKKHGQILGVPVLVVLVLLGFIWVPDFLFQLDYSTIEVDASQKAGRIFEYRKVYIQIIGGAILAIGVYLTLRRVKATEKQAEVALQGNLTDRYTKAVELLGSDQMAIRIGGIAALGRLAKDSEIDYKRVIITLAEFIRYVSVERQKEMREEERGSGDFKLWPDVQMAINVIFNEEFYPLAKMYFDKETSPIDLSEAYLKSVNLSGKKLINVNFQLSNLDGGKFMESKLDACELFGAEMKHCHFRQGRFFECKLEFAKLDSSQMKETSFIECRLEGISVWNVFYEKTLFKGCTMDDETVEDLLAEDVVIE